MRQLIALVIVSVIIYLILLSWGQGSHMWELEQRISLLESIEPRKSSQHVNKNNKKSNVKNLTSRVTYIENKLNGHLTWGIDPHMWDKVVFLCKKIVKVGKFDKRGKCPECFPVCADFWDQQPPCVVYDFGIRKEPQFGVHMAKDYGCEVHGFDPSPITLSWFKEKGMDIQEEAGPNYHMHPYGAGGYDGMFDLFKYSWQQITIARKYPSPELRRPHLEESRFPVPLKRLHTIMKDLGHSHLFYLKIDIEGSEYMFLADLFDSFPKRIFDLLTVEFHNFNHDTRYGSSPEITTFVSLLRKWHVYLYLQSSQYILTKSRASGYYIKEMAFVYVPPEHRHRVNKTGWFKWQSW